MSKSGTEQRTSILLRMAHKLHDLPRKYLRKNRLVRSLRCALNRYAGISFVNPWIHQTADSEGTRLFREQQAEMGQQDQQKQISTFVYKPLVSVLTPLYKPNLHWLQIAIDSVRAQSYENWELCLVDDGSQDTKLAAFLNTLHTEEPRIHYRILSDNSGISAATNAAFTTASGTYIALMDQDDELTPDALFHFIKYLQSSPDADFLYSDECRISADGRHRLSYFYAKPDWSPEFLLSGMYTGHLTLYRASLVRTIGGFRSKYDYSQDYDLALRMSEVARSIVHVERILYLWRTLPGSGAANQKKYARRSNIAAAADWYIRHGMTSLQRCSPNANYGGLVLQENPLVSIVIPSDSESALISSLHMILESSSYSNMELVTVTTSAIAKSLTREFCYLPNLTICRYNKPFNFSDKCNEGVKCASGEYVLFLNDDITAVTADWIERMLEILYYPGVGGVSPMILNDNNSIQYAGIISGVPGLTDTAFRLTPLGYTYRIPFSYYNLRDVSVLHGACLMMKKVLFRELGGFDAIHTPNGHSDVDLSFRIQEAGFRCVYTPWAQVTHAAQHNWVQKASRDKADIYCLRRWGGNLTRDIYFTDSQKKLYFHDYRCFYHIFGVQENRKLNRYQGDVLFILDSLRSSDSMNAIEKGIREVNQSGCYVVVTSPCDGAMRVKLHDKGITVIHDPTQRRCEPIFERFANNFDVLVLCGRHHIRVYKRLQNLLPPVLCWPSADQVDAEEVIQKIRLISEHPS